jgi:hypothetical protein
MVPSAVPASQVPVVVQPEVSPASASGLTSTTAMLRSAMSMSPSSISALTIGDYICKIFYL